MQQKTLFLILIISLFVQLGFSFYFNSEIISQNQIYTKYTQDIAQIEKTNQLLENEFTKLSSLNSLFSQASSSAFKQIHQEVDLYQIHQ